MRHHNPEIPSSEDSVTIEHAPRRGKRFAGIVATLVVCVVLVLFAVLLVRGPGSSQSLSSSGPSVPVAWQSYRDPAGLFTVRLPASWSVRLDTSSATFGDRTGSATETQEMIRFTDPAQGNASAAVFVTVAPIRTDFERHWYCNAWRSSEHESFHGYPATSMSPMSATWLFESATAHFQFDYMIPGVAGPAHSSPMMLTPVPTPTRLPKATIDTDTTIVNTILASFQPTSASPLSC